MQSVHKQYLTLIGFALMVLTAAASPAYAHAAEQGFVLLLPTDAYIMGGAIVVAATILLLFFLRQGWLEAAFRPFDTGISAAYFSPPHFVSLGGALVLGGLIAIGFFGPTDPQANLWPLALWTVWWIALFVVQGVIFDVWKWVNPWLGLHRLLFPDQRALIPLPSRVGVWPALSLFITFQGFVLADTAPNEPDRLAKLALGYWAFTFAGMTLFERKSWLEQVECFTVLFNLIGRLRIAGGVHTLKIGLPGWQIIHGSEFNLSQAAFTLVLLAAGSFDGLYETFWWLGKLGVNPLEYPGRSAMIWKTTLGYYGAISTLIAIFASAVWIGLALIRNQPEHPMSPYHKAFTGFSTTLLPIAIGYHFAHYFTTFIIQIQVFVVNLADPLARGWNLFGLAETGVKHGFLAVPNTVKMIWLTQAGVVVLSHVLAVMLSHMSAFRLCRDWSNTLRVQIGLSILMIAYTIFGLWLLASPRGV